MTSVAAFSIRPWHRELPYDHVEDLLHSIGATVMGFAFVAGALAALAQRVRTRSAHMLDVAARRRHLLPPLMGLFAHIDGALQRAMFLTAYAWYVR